MLSTWAVMSHLSLIPFRLIGEVLETVGVVACGWRDG